MPRRSDRSREKGRPVSRTAFPVLRQLHISGRFQDLCTGGLSPGRVLLGCRCKSGQSRTVARTDAMVSHLHKMRRLSHHCAHGTRTRRQISPLFPLLTGGEANKGATTFKADRLVSYRRRRVQTDGLGTFSPRWGPHSVQSRKPSSVANSPSALLTRPGSLTSGKKCYRKQSRRFCGRVRGELWPKSISSTELIWINLRKRKPPAACSNLG
jgi:hypothetical protein